MSSPLATCSRAALAGALRGNLVVDFSR